MSNASEKPNIIMIMTDQHRWDAIGCSGNSVIKTPNIDGIAEDGVVFTNAFTSTPSCTPARAGLLTGLAPWNHGMLGFGRVAEKYEFELPRMLREAGYYTFGIGKMHWFPQKTLHGFHGTLVDESSRMQSKGFISDYRKWFKEVAPDKNPDVTGLNWNGNRFADYALDEELHPTYWTGQTAVDKIQEYDKSKPLFLKVSFARPHSPYDAPKRFADMYDWEDMPEPVLGDWIDKFTPHKGGNSPFFGNFGVERAKKARKHYYGNITFIDEQIGRILDALKQKGMYENSLIVFTADHGDMLGDHHHWRKTYAYNGSARIPMILKWPEKFKTVVERDSKINQVVELRDILPTFLSACGVKIPEKMDGDSMLNLVTQSEPEWREFIDLEHSICYDRCNYWMALTDGKMKYIFFRSTGEEQLFDLEKDPDELHELSGDPNYKSSLEMWRERMVQHLSVRGKKWVKNGKLRKNKKRNLYSPNYPK